jgi:hypothetical protein
MRKVQFDNKCDDAHVPNLSAKYGGVKYVDTEDPSKSHTFQMPNCVQLTKCRKSVTREQMIRGKGMFYTLVGVYESFNLSFKLLQNYSGIPDSSVKYYFLHRNWLL